MKRLVLLSATVVACIVVVAGTANASGGGGRVVESEFPCTVLDGNGNPFVTSNSTLTVYSNQQGAKAVLRCVGDGAGAPSLTYFNYANTGLSCGTQFGSTTDWSDKVGRNGNSQLTCTVNLDNLQRAAAGSNTGLG